jgi:hypothetical protein
MQALLIRPMAFAELASTPDNDRQFSAPLRNACGWPGESSYFASVMDFAFVAKYRDVYGSFV